MSLYIKISCLLVSAILIIGCFKERSENPVKYYSEKNYLLKEEFANGIIKYKSVYTKDTLHIKNKIEYYLNGKTKKWSFYNNLSKYPLLIVYYDSLGNYINFKGTPFIRGGINAKEDFVIELANPPNIDVLLVYNDSLKNNLEHQTIYEPFKTDSTLWVTLDKFKYVENHKYFLKCKFYFKNKQVDSLSTELAQ